MSETKILIVGGGLAGLALGQALKQANISFHIFERDQDAAFRAQGYRIRISQEGGDALAQLLPIELFDLFERTSAPVVEGGVWLSAATAQADDKAHGMPGRTGSKAWNVDRTVLRQILLRGIDQHVSFDKKFSRYSLASDREVTAHFADGSTSNGTLLIGADGTHSAVRHQLHPSHVLLDTGGLAIYGKTSLDALPPSMPSEILNKGIAITTHPDQPEIKLFSDTMRFSRKGEKESTSASSFSPVLPLPPDYLYWVLIFQEATAPSNPRSTLAQTPEQAAALTVQMTQHWDSSLHSIFTQQLATAASPLGFLSSKPGTENLAWETETEARVTLLGDAAHPNLPVGGVGANGAFVDAMHLKDCLLEIEGGDRGSTDQQRRCLLASYEKGCVGRATASMERAAVGAGKLLGVKPASEWTVAER
jgi:2-polyprenyl-6-methoxyphenol hydroxylase-like FAD-dependent oxidoreductase